MNKLRIGLTGIVLFLAGCSFPAIDSNPPYSKPPESEPLASISYASLTIPAQPALSQLAQVADQKYMQGAYQKAVIEIERALRIAPRNHLLWQRLSRARLAMGEYQNAESLALKANSFAAVDVTAQIINWRLIADARLAAGNAAGASKAEQRMRLLQRAR